jgi:hypothetical protein
MATHKPTYFLTPPRPAGPIHLGAIITSPTRPDEPLHQPALPPSTDISTIKEYNWSGTHVKTRSTHFGVWASFLEMILSIGGDVSVSSSKKMHQHWEVERMTTRSFFPSNAFIAGAVAHELVREYITETLFREKIYMITGVMLARATESVRESLVERGVMLSVGVDATAWTGVPVSAGPEGEWARSEGKREESVREDEFVFAYRVREIKVRRKGGVKAHRGYDRGALFNTEKKREKKREKEEAIEVEVVGLGDDVDDEGEGLETMEVLQDSYDGEQEECVVYVVPGEE